MCALSEPGNHLWDEERQLGLQGFQGTDSPPLPHSSPQPLGLVLLLHRHEETRLREVMCIAQGHTANLGGSGSDTSPMLFP